MRIQASPQKTPLVRHRALVVLAAMASLLASQTTRADRGEAREVEALRLVHELEDVGADYSSEEEEADEDEEIAAERAEAERERRLFDDAAGIARRLGTIAAPGGAPLDLGAEVVRIRGLVDGKAETAIVRAAIDAATHVLIGAFRLEVAPRTPPGFARGKVLFAEHCATCHGATGRADTARAGTFIPTPANFVHGSPGEMLSPFRVTTTLRFGVEGTAMIPFTFLSDAERWDLAFYVVGLRYVGDALVRAPPYALADLAALSNGELGRSLRESGVPDARIEGLIADLRRRAPYEDATPPARRSPFASAAKAAIAVGILVMAIAAAFALRRRGRGAPSPLRGDGVRG